MTTPGTKARYGRRASDRPRYGGWKGIFYPLGRALYEDTLITYASSAAFFAFLTLFPALAATLSLTGLVVSSEHVELLLQGLHGLMPDAVLVLLREQITSIVSFSRPGLGFTLLVSLLFTFWSASQGMKALMHGLNAAYQAHEWRSALRLNTIALALGVGAVLFAMGALALIAALPPVLATLRPGIRILQFLRWPLLAIAGFGALAVLYRYGPAYHAPRWRFVTLGAIIATTVWILASVGFSVYVSNVSAYNAAYGALGTIVILLLWFYLGAWIVLVGAELNAALEHRGARLTIDAGA
jgi:membrane protein